MGGPSHPGFAYGSPSAAIDALVAHIEPVNGERIPASRCAGRILGGPIRTDRPSPAVDVTSMDGFAVHAESVRSGRARIAAEVRMGHAPPGAPPPDPDGMPPCARITTGGALPEWADAIVRREDARESEGVIEIDAEVARTIRAGAWVRCAGENAGTGEVIGEPGAIITPGLFGAIAQVGIDTVEVFRALRIAVITTGDELAPPSVAPTPWQIRDANNPVLDAMLSSLGFVAGIECFRAPDDEPALDALLADVLVRVDALILSGGVSAGHRDFVPGALARAGARIIFHGLPQRPGRPILAGVTESGAPVLALPGNPVSVAVTARRIAVPVLAHRAGARIIDACPTVRISSPDDRRISLWWHRLVRLTGDGAGELVDTKGSGDLVSAARADGFVEIPPNESGSGPWPFRAWTPTLIGLPTTTP